MDLELEMSDGSDVTSTLSSDCDSEELVGVITGPSEPAGQIWPVTILKITNNMLAILLNM